MLFKSSSTAELSSDFRGETLNWRFMALTDRIRQALKDAGISHAEIARRLGVTPQAVNGWFRTGRISKSSLSGIAKETGVSLEYLLGPHQIQPSGIPSGEAFGRPTIIGSGDLRAGEATVEGYGRVLRNVPIVGNAVATPDKDGYFDDMGFPVGAGEGYLPWPTKDPNAYALRVKGDSMQPRIRPGELIIVEPNKAVAAGDDVVVRCKDGRKMVKQLLLKRDGEVTLGSINQAHRQVTISLDEIESLQFVTAIVPRSSFVKEGL